MIVQGEKKIAYAGFKSWKQNDLYPDDFTKRYHSIAYGMDQETLYLSVDCSTLPTGKSIPSGSILKIP